MPADADAHVYLGVNDLVWLGADETMQFPERVIEEQGLMREYEAKAGMDVRTLKPRYGDWLVFYANIDVRKLAASKQDIQEEISSKSAVAKENGGYIYHSDHSVPSNVSLENYRYATAAPMMKECAA